MSVARCATPACSAGFTLLELLVAMFIAAVIFAMGYGAINQAVKSRVELQEQQAKLLELQTAVRTIEQDLVQLAPRPIREPVGTTANFQPALISSTTTQPLLALTRAGWTNPTGLQRPALQRVAYYFENGTLRREYWTVLDPTQSSIPVRRDLLTHLKSVSLRFLDRGTGQITAQGGTAQNWQPQWPPVMNNVGQNNNRYRPIAIEVTLETEDWGKVVRVVEIAG
jgi:general secretion pathway protein J